MNTLIINGVVRWAVNTVIGALLGAGLIHVTDTAAWTNTFTEFFSATISIVMLFWVIVQNRWPNLVHVTSLLPQVNKVTVERGTVMTEAMKDNPSVVVAPMSTNG